MLGKLFVSKTFFKENFLLGTLFVRHTFCDWYIEFMKPIFNSGKEFQIIETRFVAKSIMENILKFLHPLMPFITEECHEFFYKSKKLLITSSWPKKIEIGISHEIIVP